ncbi:cold-shock protein [Rhizobium leguminosarum]|uniref:cold-shock protein n=1 Tax=Rhizobium leguminosarum TaxID=384 RepID=UPI003D7C1BB1
MNTPPKTRASEKLVATGTVKFISAVQGGSLRDGQAVSYELGQDRKTGKSKAENVRPT